MKRFLTLVLTISVSLAIFVLAANFVPSDWAQDSVNIAEKEGLTDDTEYNYSAPITREEFCELIYNYCTKINGDLVLDDGFVDFTDTDNFKIQVLSTMGIINGKGENTFAPKDLLTREEAATILFRLIGAMHPDWTAHELYFEFEDADLISDWAMDNIQIICNMGIMNGVGGGKFAPKDNFTTEQAITTVVRVYNAFNPSSESFADRLNVTMPDDKNYMFSPLSIKMALLMAANGAEGETQFEILNTIGVEDINAYNAEVKELIEKYSQSELLTLKVSNSIWMNKSKSDMEFSGTYKKLVADIFGANAESVTDKDAVERINSWVNDSTNGKIPAIINNSDFWACLINAVYFKGRWADEFRSASTKKGTFTTRDKTDKTVDFMNKTDWMSVADVDGVTIVELPYLICEDKYDEDWQHIETIILDNMDVSMYLMMSDGEFSPEKVLASTEMSSGYISLSVPKFKIEYETKLNDTLKTLGINRAFTTDAEFGKMFNDDNMWIDDTIHKTFISVDEEGTEAAAVTSIAMAGSALPPQPREIKFNKPFTFVIKDNISGEILFMGEYAY